MILEQSLRDGLSAVLDGLAVPDAPISSIRARIGAPSSVPVAFTPFRALAIAASVALIATVATPLVTPGFTASLEQRVAQILHWSPPAVPLPASLRPVLQGHAIGLSAAQHAVDFSIVPPDGLPSGSALAWIRLASTGEYSAKTHHWSTGSKYVEFGYRSADGGTFTLTASSTSMLTQAPSRYMLEERGTDKNGNPILLRRERFVWRNGDQIMTAIVGDYLSVNEIMAVRDAMHGEPVATVWPPKPSHDAVLRLIQKRPR